MGAQEEVSGGACAARGWIAVTDWLRPRRGDAVHARAGGAGRSSRAVVVARSLVSVALRDGARRRAALLGDARHGGGDALAPITDAQLAPLLRAYPVRR